MMMMAMPPLAPVACSSAAAGLVGPRRAARTSPLRATQHGAVAAVGDASAVLGSPYKAAAGALVATGVVVAQRRRARGRGVAPRAARFEAVLRRALATAAASSANAPVTELFASLPPAPSASGFSLLLVPRPRAAELGQLHAAVSQHFGGSGGPVVAALSGAGPLALAVSSGAAAEVFELDTAASLPQDVEILAAKAAEGDRTVVLLAGHAAPPPALRTALKALSDRLPKLAVAGVAVLPPKDPNAPSVWGPAGACLGSKILGLLLPGGAARAVTDVCSFEPFGAPLEIFEASLAKSSPAVLLKIGTDEEGRVEDAEETEKGTAGIARRVSIPAAAAVQRNMKEVGVTGPKEVWIGVPGTPRSNGIPVASAPSAGGVGLQSWSLFPWAGMTKEGGVVLGGKGPVPEGLCPKNSLAWAQCFRSGVASEGPLATAIAQAPPAGALLFSGLGAPAAPLPELGPRALRLQGAAVLGSTAAGAPADAHPRGVAMVALSG